MDFLGKFTIIHHIATNLVHYMESDIPIESKLFHVYDMSKKSTSFGGWKIATGCETSKNLIIFKKSR